MRKKFESPVVEPRVAFGLVTPGSVVAYQQEKLESPAPEPRVTFGLDTLGSAVA
jgi:hypothetical protein